MKASARCRAPFSSRGILPIFPPLVKKPVEWGFAASLYMKEVAIGSSGWKLKDVEFGYDSIEDLMLGKATLEVPAFELTAEVLGDLNGDSKVGFGDLFLMATRYGTNDSSADIHADGAVNRKDVLDLVARWNKDYSE
jgi:hypothetical protein